MTSGGFNDQPRLAYLKMPVGFPDLAVLVWHSVMGPEQRIMARRIQADGNAGDQRGPMVLNATSQEMPVSNGARPALFVHTGDRTVTVMWGDMTTNALAGSVIP
jgi:hypothetical protein